jgi:antitoxin (DNA-binding transcriptional repressor) of toxin-antitoxin stability system
MRKKSEPADPLKVRVSATEASRSFSRLLDEVESGRRFVIHRRGRDLCTMAPAAAEGRRASECLDLLRARSPVLLDEGFGEDLLRALAEESPEERPSWDS